MDYLLTWIDGEEVRYRFIPDWEIKDIEIEVDIPCTLTEIRHGKVIEDISRFFNLESEKDQTKT